MEELNRIFREETGENVTDMGAVDCQETLKRVLARSASDGAASGGASSA